MSNTRKPCRSHEASGGSLEIPSIGVCVLKHQAQDSDAMCGEIGEVGINSRYVTATIQTSKSRPRYGIVGADEEERFPVCGFEVPPAGRDADW